MTHDDIDLIDYSGFFQDIVRISHAVDTISPPPTQEKLSHLKPEVADEMLDREIRQRKAIMAGLHVEIEELKEVRKKL